MKISCDRNTLSNAFNLAQHAISNTLFGKKTQLVLVPHVTTSTLEIIGNNPIFGYFIQIPAEYDVPEDVEKFPPIVVDADLFSKVIKRGNESLVVLNLYQKDFDIKIKIGSFVSKLRGYAELPFEITKKYDKDSGDEFIIPSKNLCKLLAATYWAASDDAKKPHLQVCQINVLDKLLSVRATDSYVIAIAQTDLDEEGKTEKDKAFSFFISSDIGKELAGIDDENSDLRINNRLISFTKKKGESQIYMESSLMNTKYPDLNAYLGNLTYLNNIVVSKELFSETLNRLCIEMWNDIFPVLLEYKANEKKIYLKNIRNEYEFYESMPVEKGDKNDFVCAFDIKKVLAAIKGANALNNEPNIILRYCGEKLPIILSTNSYNAYIMVINTNMLNK